MKELIQAYQNTDYTFVVLFGVIISLIILVMELNDSRKNQDYYIIQNHAVKNDYDPIVFRIIIAWCLFIAVAVIYTILNANL